MLKYILISLSISYLVAAQEAVDPKCMETNVKPSQSIGKYYVYVANTTKPCLVAQFSSYISLGQGRYLTLENGTVNANVNTTNPMGFSKCGNSTVNPQIVVTFDCGRALGLRVNHSNDSKITYIKLIDGIFQNNNATVRFINTTESFQTTQTGRYYKCNAEQRLALTTTPIAMPNVTLVMSNFAYEAYRDVPGTDFYGVPEECALDAQPVSDLVRVAVGICLIALVAIVLVAYFIGRRRWSERSSYESV